jgi:hypothetical protein
MEYLILFIIELLVLFFLSWKLQRRLSIIFYRLTGSRKLTVWLMAVLFLPGTLVHELAHYLTAFFLFVPVKELELIPKFQGGQVKLASVRIGKTDPVRKFLIGVAPVVGGISIILSILFFAPIIRVVEEWWRVLIIGIVVFEIGNTMFLSKDDLAGVWKLIVIVVAMCFVLYTLGFQASLVSLDKLLLSEVVELTKRACYFLLVPLGIDTAVILALMPFRIEGRR